MFLLQMHLIAGLVAWNLGHLLPLHYSAKAVLEAVTEPANALSQLKGALSGVRAIVNRCDVSVSYDI